MVSPLIPELLDQRAQVQLYLARLPAQREELLHPLLRRPGRERLVEAVRFFEEPVHRRQLGGVDGRLRERDRLGRKRRDPAGQAIDEGAELGGRQRAVYVTVALRQLGGKILAAEDDLERAAPAHEAREPLRAAAAGDDPQRHLGLRQDRAPERAEAHVEREEELAPPAARAALDFPDGRLRHGAEAVHHGVEEPEARRLGRHGGGQRLDERHVRVRDEELGVGALEDDDAYVAVRLQLAPDPVHLPDERQVEEVDGRVVDGDRGDAAVGVNLQAVVPLVGHPTSLLRSTRRRDDRRGTGAKQGKRPWPAAAGTGVSLAWDRAHPVEWGWRPWSVCGRNDCLAAVWPRVDRTNRCAGRGPATSVRWRCLRLEEPHEVDPVSRW